MCGVISSIFRGVSDVISAVVDPVAGLLGGSPEQQQPQAPAAPVLPPQAQAAQAPDEQARRASQRAARPTGAPATVGAETMLTGPGGVTKDLLNLGKNSLLGQ